jgi:hypothetical protein
MTPPPVDWPVENCRSNLPVAASKARKLPSRSTVINSPLAVATMPEIIGAVAWWRQRTAPESASTAVTQPAFFGSCWPKPLLEPRNVLPASNSGTSGLSFSVEHQSMLLTYTRLVAAE